MNIHRVPCPVSGYYMVSPQQLDELKKSHIATMIHCFTPLVHVRLHEPAIWGGYKNRGTFLSSLGYRFQPSSVFLNRYTPRFPSHGLDLHTCGDVFSSFQILFVSTTVICEITIYLHHVSVFIVLDHNGGNKYFLYRIWFSV